MSPRRRSNPNAERRLHRGPAPAWRGNRVFYVAVEGEATEPDYLAMLNREFGSDHQFLIHPLYKRNGMTPTRVVAKALEQRDEVASGDGRVQLWALFDRDQHHEIPQAMRAARAGGVRVAFSHPSFDLWLLLHFTDVSGQQDGSSRIVHQKLRQCTGFETFDLHNDKSVSGPRAQALHGRYLDAVRRAKRLVDDCPSGACSASDGHVQSCDALRRDPSTDVWQLLVELGIAGR
ncbi:RloB family protein [Dactylosporangium sp. CA-092794]|uniref:RloB family protein n=1 Tax=Dactylosporangium sp. CA-092794 TaxID=3239929 RepID=UPI003D91021F